MTSFKEYVNAINPNLFNHCSCLSDYKDLRVLLIQYGIERFKETETISNRYIFTKNELNIEENSWYKTWSGYIYKYLLETYYRSSILIPFTFFKVMKYSEESDQDCIPQNLKNKYIILRNKEEYGGIGPQDSNWLIAKENEDASMSAYHQFIGIKDTSWQYFNALTFGLEISESYKSVLNMFNELEIIANLWAKKNNIPKEYLGCYFHIYPFNSVQSLHMHMIDLRKENLGKAYFKSCHKNMPLSEVRKYFESSV